MYFNFSGLFGQSPEVPNQRPLKCLGVLSLAGSLVVRVSLFIALAGFWFLSGCLPPLVIASRIDDRSRGRHGPGTRPRNIDRPPGAHVCAVGHLWVGIVSWSFSACCRATPLDAVVEDFAAEHLPALDEFFLRSKVS